MLFLNRVPMKFLDAGASTGGEAPPSTGGAGAGGDKTPPKEGAPAETKPDDQEDLDVEKLDPKVQNYIKNLRKENGKHRTKANATEAALVRQQAEVKDIKKRLAKLSGEEVADDDETPLEERFSHAQAAVQGLVVQNAILQMSHDYDIPKDSVKYFQFLVAEAQGNLEEGEELDEDALKALAVDARSKSKSIPGAQTSPSGKSTGQAPAANNPGTITLEKFMAMGLSEQGKLYGSNPELYKSLAAEAKLKNKTYRQG